MLLLPGHGPGTGQPVTHVAMEATGIYSMPVYHALIEHGEFTQVLACNAGHVKNITPRACIEPC